MDVDFDPDAANVAKHGVSLRFGARVLDDVDVLIVPTVRVDDEERFKAVGKVDGELWTAVHVYRGDAFHFSAQEQCW